MAVITFRPLSVDDLPALHGWLTLPHVARWWGGAPTLEEVEKEYGEYIRGEEPVHGYLVLADGRPVGHTQWMRYEDYEWYARILGIDPAGAANCDVFIGEPELLYRGLGARIVRSFVDEVIFGAPDIERCFIDPEQGNHPAIRAYEKAGFAFVRDIADDGEGGTVHLMERSRPRP
ncbi:MAG TPA: GNAT family N-acetyltransferase [Polyangiaceae bacterium]|jgi:RimJ/RimL family protein N-acetyltransferase|nr:GNAT family N-acetyltransferase [Polyangiaceae bacterium]